MKTFEKLSTTLLMEWLSLAQRELVNKKGNARKLLEACIVAAAAEMRFRWKYNLD